MERVCNGKMTGKYEVIIIGAGISGIKTAIDLYRGGVDNILILEARDCIGGRLKSVKSENFPHVTYDLGASWFHDALANPLFDKARELGNIDYYFDDGELVYFDKDDKTVPSWKFEHIAEEIICYINLSYLKDPNKPDISLKQICQEYYEKKHDLIDPDRWGKAIATIRIFGELWHGESWDNLSAKFVFDEDGHLGRNVLVKSGYSKVIQNEMNELPDKFETTNIKLNTSVKCIDYSNDIINIHTGNDSFSCDYVVLTLPRSLYSIDDPNDPSYIKWVPELPGDFKKLSHYFESGSLGKVVFEFSECFWSETVDRFYALSKQEPKNPNDPQPWDYPTILINYQANSGVPALVALTQNPLSSTIENFDPKTKNERIWQLFQPVIAQISNAKVPPQPINILHTSWNNDIWARGAYSTSKVGCPDSKTLTNLFAKGLSNKIRFAGSETVDGSANGCAHGGWFSGQREAKYILEDIAKKL